MSDKKKIVYTESEQKVIDPIDEANNEIIRKAESLNPVLSTLVKAAQGSSNKKRGIARLAFTEKPMQMDHYAGVFKLKSKLLPPSVIKDVAVQNFLVAGILRTRGYMMSMYGRRRPSRFDIGIDCVIKNEFKDHIEPEQMPIIKERIERTLKFLINCGDTKGLDETEKMTLSDFLYLQTTNALRFGKFDTENVFEDKDQKTLNRFRPVDAGTIYNTVKKDDSAENIRKMSIKLLEGLNGKKIDTAALDQDKYAYVQVVDGTPRQAFTAKELVSFQITPSSDIEHNGYPLTILDTIITAVTTHISAEVYNKLYFQNGRASKGMMVIKSDEMDQGVIEDIKQQFNASINNVGNSFRTPIFGVSKEDDVEWVNTSPQKKDGEFSYLSDKVARDILMSFNMSPDELPAYNYLGRATNSQALSESNNEYKLTSARDSGIRPLILKFEDFFNNKLFPLIDPELSQICTISLSGFDSETRSQESERIARDSSIYYDYNQIMDEVEKNPVPASMGGNVPFNPNYRQILDQYMDVSKVAGFFLEDPSAFFDPAMKYKRDPNFFQAMQNLAQANPEAFRAYYASNPMNKDLLKMLIQDMLDEEDQV